MKLPEALWQVGAGMTDVEAGDIVRAELFAKPQTLYTQALAICVRWLS